jgi:hypothetical protein
VDVEAERLPAPLRVPNQIFVAVVEGVELPRVEEDDGPVWLEIQDQIRAVLNGSWDPIGVAGVVRDEYDSYIGGIYALLLRGADDHELAQHLALIETKSMGLRPSAPDLLARVVRELRLLELPRVHA